jgi:nickel-dependent lactate racemase
VSVKKVKVPWRAWYGDKDYKLTFPEEWSIQVLDHEGARPLPRKEIEVRLDAPIGSPPLSELARGRGSVTIAVDDLARPTPAAKLLPVIVARLTDAGIKPHDIRIIMSVAAHRPCTRQDLAKKIGEKLIDSVEVINHNPFDDLVNLGETGRGTAIQINAPFMDGDLRIGIGCIIPHYGPGFSGGGKIVLPGLAGIESLRANHTAMARGLPGGLACVEGNEQQEDIREAARRAGLEFIVNVVVSRKRQIVGVFAGDLVQAHSAGIEFAREVYSTKVQADLDVAICNAYPKDTDFMQSINAFNGLVTSPPGTLKENGTVVLTTASTEGRGYHSLFGRGMSLEKAMDVEKTFGGRELFVFSPNIAEYDVKAAYHEPVRLFRRWGRLLKALRRKHGQTCRVGVFPCGPIQLAEGYDPETGAAGLIMR